MSKDWVIRKRGYFYRPNRAGYTSSIQEAGLYSEEEARREAAIEPSCMSAHRVTEFSEQAFDDTAQQIAVLVAEAKREGRREGLEEAATRIQGLGEKWGDPTGDGYAQGCWDQAARSLAAIRALIEKDPLPCRMTSPSWRTGCHDLFVSRTTLCATAQCAAS